MKPYTKFWKELANNKKITPHDVVIHCALKAFFAKSTNETSKEDIFKAQIEKSFTPIKNKNRLANGAVPWQAVKDSLFWLTFYKKVTFFGLLKDNIVNDIFETEERYEEFNTFLISLAKAKLKFNKRHYTYIFVDQENVPSIYQAVQAAHVAMVIGQKMDKKHDSNNIYFQVCKKPDDLKFSDLYGYLIGKGYKVETFYEPDVDRTIAIGTHPIPSYKRMPLKKFELLSFDDK